MERKSVGVKIAMVVLVMVVMVVLMVAENGAAQPGPNGAYACWGGCYNQFILQNGKNSSESLTCYNNCLSGCNYQYYCQIGCSFNLCFPVSSDGEIMGKCIDWCANFCKR